MLNKDKTVILTLKIWYFSKYNKFVINFKFLIKFRVYKPIFPFIFVYNTFQELMHISFDECKTNLDIRCDNDKKKPKKNKIKQIIPLQENDESSVA